MTDIHDGTVLSKEVIDIAKILLSPDNQDEWFEATAKQLGISLERMKKWQIPSDKGDLLAEALGYKSLAVMLEQNKDIAPAAEAPQRKPTYPSKKTLSREQGATGYDKKKEKYKTLQIVNGPKPRRKDGEPVFYLAPSPTTLNPFADTPPQIT